MYPQRSLVILLLLTVNTGVTRAQTIHAFDRGVVMLDSLDLSNNKIISLTGEWEFYWNKLLDPEHFNLLTPYPVYAKVPAFWNTYRVDGKMLPNTGYATYRLRLINSRQTPHLMMRFMGISSSCKIWVNGVLTEKQGVVAASADAVVVRRTSCYIPLPAQDSIDVIIQVANFHTYRAGINYRVEIGQYADIVRRDRNVETIEMIGLGLIIMLLFFNLLLYTQVNQQRFFLILSAICFTAIVRIVLVYDGSLLLFRILPSADFIFFKNVELCCLYANVFLFPAFICSIFKYHNVRRIRHFFLWPTLVLIAGVMVLPSRLTNYTLIPFYVSFTASFTFAFYLSIRALLLRMPDTVPIFFGMFLGLLFFFWEIAHLAGVLPNTLPELPNLGIVGILTFLLFESVAATAMLARSFNGYQQLSRNLESLVDKKTEQIRESNFIRERMLAVISHDLRSPLNSLYGIVELITSQKINSREARYLMTAMKQTLSSARELLENLLVWSSVQIKGVSRRLVTINLHSATQLIIQDFDRIASLKSISLNNHVPESIVILGDEHLFSMVLRNLISNAIKFTRDQGLIVISAFFDDAKVWIQVEDSGVGMSKIQLKRLLNPSELVSYPGTNQERGIGLGLLLCKECLEKDGNRLLADSVEGKGTTIRFSMNP